MNFSKYALWGFLMGVAESIPGVNGVTVALLLGFYTRIIDAIKQWTPTHLLSTLKNSGSIQKKLKDLELEFLIAIVLGTVLAIWIFSGFMPGLLNAFPSQSNAFIFGLVGISVYIPFRYVTSWDAKHFGIALVSAIFSYGLLGVPMGLAEHSPLVLFLCGAMGACALLLPGLSGSFLLKALGQYEYMLDHLHQAFAFQPESLTVVVVFVAGMATGILLFAKLLSWFLHHHLSMVMASLGGITLGALRAVWPLHMSLPPTEAASLLAFMLVGGAFMAFLIWAESSTTEPK